MFIAFRIRNSVLACAISIGGGLAFLSAPAHAQAVSIDLNEKLGDLKLDFDKLIRQAVTVSPALTRIEGKQSSVTVTLTNPSKDTLNVDLSVSALSPLAALGLKNGDKWGKGLLAESGSTDTSAADTIEAGRSMETWVKELPQRVRLAPGENRSLTIKLDIPSELKTGEYSVWIVATTLFSSLSSSGDAPSGGGSFTISFGGKKKTGQLASSDEASFKFPNGAKLTYVAK